MITSKPTWVQKLRFEVDDLKCEVVDLQTVNAALLAALESLNVGNYGLNVLTETWDKVRVVLARAKEGKP